LRWVLVPGGFSGAHVWRGEDSGNALFALKAWPSEVTPERLTQIHRWMMQAAHLSFIPRVLPTAKGTSFVTERVRLWDLTRWMPGTTRDKPVAGEVEAACAAVARVHVCWPQTGFAPAPAVLTRLRVLGEGVPAVSEPERSALPDELSELLHRASCIVAQAAPGAARKMAAWATTALPIQPCIRDLRGEHVLFSGTTVSGMVDFGALSEDHPATDLARLLADFAGADDNLFSVGLRAYRHAGGTLSGPEEFVRHLAQAGIVCSVMGWLQRLAGHAGHFKTEAITRRLRHLLARVELFDNDC
jgi:homoserine kinase type II